MNNLTHKKAFHEAVKAGKTPVDIGFSTEITTGDINRFASRYRVARAFRGVTLDGFSEATTRGYSALFRLFLAWSTFEQFLAISGLKQSDGSVEKLFDEHNAEELCKKIRKHDKDKAFYLFLSSQVNNSHKSEIEKLFGGKKLNASYLASAIRHIFAHGKLTPHANKSYPKRVVDMCDLISEFLLNLVDSEFSKRVN